MKYPFKIVGKVHFLCFWQITFEQSELKGKNPPPFVDLNEMHMPSKFHVNTRLLRRSKGKKASIFDQFKFADFTKNT